MNKLFLLFLAALTTASLHAENLEYQQMLAVRAKILELPLQQTPQPLPVLVQEEEMLNSDVTDLLQQLKTLDASH
jgi:hypothetical protein